MFTHNFKYALKTIFKNKALIFWTFAFPIILGSFFKMAFSNIQESEKLKVINIAVVENEVFKNSDIYKETFKTLSDENNKERLFLTKYTTEEEAKELLEDDKIVGYLLLDSNKPNLVFNTNGIDQTVFKYVIEEIESTSSIISNLSSIEARKNIKNGNYNIDYESLHQKISKLINEDDVKINDISSNNLDYMMIEFYTLIAMTCLYGGMLSMTSINQNLPNMSNKGKRIAVSPSKKSYIILSSLLASFVAQLIGLLILFIYTIFVLNINYGDNIIFIILLSIVGSLSGLSLGLAIGSILKTNENVKIGILIASTMLFCFLSGMMGVTMKYIIDKNVPLLGRINPANMITDGFYSLYYYETYDRYYTSVISLLIFAFILILLSFNSLRRQKYDSI